MKHWVLQSAIAFDQLLTALIGGYADETLSSYAWRLEQQRKPWGKFWRPKIDWFFALFGEENHCRKSYEAERRRSQLPPELR